MSSENLQLLASEYHSGATDVEEYCFGLVDIQYIFIVTNALKLRGPA